MRIGVYVVAMMSLSASVVRAQQQPPPQYPPPPYGQPQYPPPQYAQPQYPPPQQANPLQDPARYAHWQQLRNTSHKLRLGGRVGLGVGIPLFIIGLSVGIVSVYNNGVYLCSGVSCDRTVAAGVGFTLAVLGAAGIGTGIALLVMSGSYYEKSERVRQGLEAMNYLPRLTPLARLDGHAGFDGAALTWGFTF